MWRPLTARQAHLNAFLGCPDRNHSEDSGITKPVVSGSVHRSVSQVELVKDTWQQHTDCPRETEALARGSGMCTGWFSWWSDTSLSVS